MDLGADKPTITIADTRGSLDLPAKAALLSTFELQNAHPQLIRITTGEFSAVCPGTGLPDIGHLLIEYIPHKLAVELKALKYYLFSFRDDAIFQEPVTDIIFGHLYSLLQPRYMRIEMSYNTRGGFDTTVEVERGNRSLANPDLAVQLSKQTNEPPLNP